MGKPYLQGTPSCEMLRQFYAKCKNWRLSITDQNTRTLVFYLKFEASEIYNEILFTRNFHRWQ